MCGKDNQSCGEECCFLSSISTSFCIVTIFRDTPIHQLINTIDPRHIIHSIPRQTLRTLRRLWSPCCIRRTQIQINSMRIPRWIWICLNERIILAILTLMSSKRTKFHIMAVSCRRVRLASIRQLVGRRRGAEESGAESAEEFLGCWYRGTHLFVH